MSTIPYLDKILAAMTDHLAGEIGWADGKLRSLCESPIEVALGTALLIYDKLMISGMGPLVLCRNDPAEITDYGPNYRLLIPQFEWNGRRIDFLLRDHGIELFIECDGHDFHERTKEQARRDRGRDRDAQYDGKHILRFTGSEIYASPVQCAEYVFDFLSTQHINRSLQR